MANQNLRSDELEIRLQAPHTAKGTTPFRDVQFLFVQDLRELNLPKIIERNSGKAKCRPVNAHNDSENADTPQVGCSKKATGISLPTFKTVPTKVFTMFKQSNVKSDVSEVSQYTQMSVTTNSGDSTELESNSSFDDGRQQNFRRASWTTLDPSEADEASQREHVAGVKKQEEDLQKNSEDPVWSEDCFSALYKRIEGLEILLQKGLDTFKDKCTCKEKSKNQRNVHPSKVALPEKSKPLLGGELLALSEIVRRLIEWNTSGDPGENSFARERKQNRDSDNELQSIKKRLVALEEKMRRLNLSTDESESNDQSPSKSILTLKKARENKNQVADERPSDSTAETYSVTDSFHQNEILPLNNDRLNDWKAKQVSKRIFTRHRRRKSNSLTGSKKSSQSRTDSATSWNCPSDCSSNRTLCSFHEQPVPESSKKTTAVFYVKCQKASMAWPLTKYAERKRSKPKHLCRKVPVTNFVQSQPKNGESVLDDPRAYGDCKLAASSKSGRSKKESGGHAFRRWPSRWVVSKRRSRHAPTNEEFARWRSKKDKRPDVAASLESVGQIVRSGDEIKIPVLFKEICKPMKPVQKISNISMRFVLVENEPENPFGKLLVKLLRGRSRNTTEQYVFGVNKCSCPESKCNPQKNHQKGNHSKQRRNQVIQSVVNSEQKVAPSSPCRSDCFCG